MLLLTQLLSVGRLVSIDAIAYKEVSRLLVFTDLIL